MKLRRPPNPTISGPSAPSEEPSATPREGETSAAADPEAPALDRETLANLRANEPPAGGLAGPAHVRAASLTSGADSVRGFLEDERTGHFGVALAEMVESGVNLAEEKADAVVTTLGHTVDALGDATTVAGAELDAKVGLMRQRFHNASAGMRGAADEMRAWADGQVAERKQLHEAARAQQTADVVSALADELDAVVELPSMSEMLMRGGSALLRVMAGGVDLFAELAHAGGKGVAAALSFVGKAAKKVAGSESLRNTGINVWGGLRVNIGSKKFNFGGSGNLFFPPLNSDDAQDGKRPDGDQTKDYADSMFFDYGVGGATPVGGAGWSKKTGGGIGVNLFFLSASVSKMSESVFVGIPGVFGVTIGRDTLRGSFTAFGGGTPILGGPKLGFYASHGFAVHTPLLDPINEKLTRPVAKTLSNVTEKIVGTCKTLWSGVKSWFGDDEPAVQHTGAETAGGGEA